MSTWTKDNCIVTTIGNQALTEISAKGGSMSFDSVWTCDTRVSPENLYGLTELPVKKQKMTLVRYTQVSSGYTINVQVTNEGLSEPYAIEMVGIYMKLNGFNDGNPFLYMVLLADEGKADHMTNISRSTYKYAIYLYHTNQATLNISLDPQDYVSAETFEASMTELNDKVLSFVYHTTFKGDESIDEGYVYLYTENYDTNPFVPPAVNSLTANPILFIHNYTGGLVFEGGGSFRGFYIDDIGPYSLVPCDYFVGSQPETYFNNENLMCTVNGDYIYIYNYFPRAEYVPIDRDLYSDFNDLPKSEGFYTLVGNASNAPITIPTDKVWSCTVLKSNETLICIAVNDYNNNIYRRSSSVGYDWSIDTTPWTSIGGGGGIQTATATFVNSSNGVSTSSNYLRLMRDDTTNALKAGDVIMCTLSSLSTIKSSNSVTVRYMDSNEIVTKYIYNTDNSTKTPCCQIPKYFLLEYDGTHFHMLTPLNITTTLSTSDPESTDGKYGDIWYTY